MKTKLWLIGALSAVLSTSVCAQKEERLQIKCYIQIENKSNIIHQFVTSEKNKQQFITAMDTKMVFMADGQTELQIIEMYECVGIDEAFKSSEALALEKITPF